MHRYSEEKEKSPTTTTADSHVRPAPCPVAKAAPTRYAVKHTVFGKRAADDAFSVEVEFKKYTLCALSSDATNILQFWEVR